jgi:hypothetical protein
MADTSAGAANIDDDADEGGDLGPDPEGDNGFHPHASEFSSAAPMDISPRPNYVELTVASTSGATNNEVAETVLRSSLSVEENVGPQYVNGLLTDNLRGSRSSVVGAPWDVGEGAVPSPARASNGPGPLLPVLPTLPGARRLVDTGISGPGPVIWPVSAFTNIASQMITGGAVVSRSLLSTGDFSGSEAPLPPGSAQGQTHAGIDQGDAIVPKQNSPGTTASATLAAMAGPARTGGNTSQAGLGQGLGQAQSVRLPINQNQAPGRGISIPSIGDVEAAQAALAAAELPCTVKLRLWPHDIRKPSAQLDPETCRLTVPHAVLCRFVTFTCICHLSRTIIAFVAIFLLWSCSSFP